MSTEAARTRRAVELGLLADSVGLVAAMRFVPLAALAAAAILYVGRLAYPVSLEMVRSRGVTR